MQLTLKPLSHPGIGEIAIGDGLFPVGRHEPPFDEFAHEAVARLSRRHARLFIQDGEAYIVDLDSLNGTTVNGSPLGKEPRILHHGDRICFAGQIEFDTKLQANEEDSLSRVHRHILTLIPERFHTIVEPVVVTEFPFLISKSSDLFTRYRESLPEQFKFLSRRHAHFFIKDDKFYIEDLGSTNGTFVAERRLDEHAVLLQEGDIVSFGGNDFVYRIHLKIIDNQTWKASDDSLLVSSVPVTASELTRTTFVTSATSFIDIFCANDDEDVAINPGVSEDGVGLRPSATGAKPDRESRKSRFSLMLGELKNAFLPEDTGRGVSGIWIGVITLLLISSLIGYSYYRDSDIRALEALMASGQYLEAADLSDEYATRHADDTKVANLAVEAITRHLLPVWQERLNAGNFDSAKRSIEHAEGILPNVTMARPYFDLLRWVTDIQEYATHRGVDKKAIHLFHEEEKIRGLIHSWDVNSSQYQKTANRIIQFVPEFSVTHASSLSHLRNLRSDESLYVAAIENLKLEIDRLLDHEQFDKLNQRLVEFKDKFPDLRGVDDLLQDLESYRLLQESITQHRWVDAIELVDSARFVTPIFLQRSENIRNLSLPPLEIAQLYKVSTEYWLAGDGEQSLQRLEPLIAGKWQAFFQSAYEHRRSVWDQYLEIKSHTDTDKAGVGLFTLFQSLDTDEDIYFVEALLQAYQDGFTQAKATADEAILSAEKAWNDYLSKGRISGLERLESSISDHYRRQAERLSTALRESSRGIETYRILDSIPAAETKQLHLDIVRESRLQRRSMDELKMVLKRDLYDKKIALLPVTD